MEKMCKISIFVELDGMTAESGFKFTIVDYKHDESLPDFIAKKSSEVIVKTLSELKSEQK